MEYLVCIIRSIFINNPSHLHIFLLVDTSEKPKLIYDFFNFPRRYYEVTWDHKGSPAIANRVLDLLKEVGLFACMNI